MESLLQDSLQGWLDLQCQMIAGAESALAVLGRSEHAPGARVARWPAGRDASARLAATVEAARRHGNVAVQGDGEGPTPSAAMHVAVPILRGTIVVGAVGVSVTGVPAGESKSIADVLRWGVRGLELVLAAEAGRVRLADRLSLAGSLLDHDELAESAHSLAGELAERLGCERVAVGVRRGGRLRVLALSSSLRFSDESDAVRDLRAAMEEATDQDAVIALPAAADDPPHAVGSHEQLLRGSGSAAVCSVPLGCRDREVGALVCEWSDASALDADARERVTEAGLLCGPILQLMTRAEATPRERLRAFTERFTERHFGSEARLAKGVLAVAAALVLLLAVAPGDYRVSARATLEGRVQRALVAAVDGYIAEANARAGDLVREGDVLARLDDRDLRLEQRSWESQKAQLESEYREALAAQDRTRVSIVRAKIDKIAAQLALAAEEIGRTNVAAPFDGIVVEGNLDRALGSPVAKGDVLFEVAPLDGYRIIVQVDDRDIADVAVGQTGRLALSALPGHPLTLEVERITPISTAEDGRNYFRVEAVLDEPAASLRPGMEGIAKIDVGERRLLWIWTHELFDWLRLWTWTFLP